ncbi:Importin subunit alpha-8 [Sciurus carolinensis]|uniref:Importin subunit alpha-8 n=1 Tax=Sciurus carolinensis TaxID=30640 RepID=A0AA41MHY5_SCICA|nr:Importin subunit alpha-8 [Sciurus carolinensis]
MSLSQTMHPTSVGPDFVNHTNHISVECHMDLMLRQELISLQGSSQAMLLVPSAFCCIVTVRISQIATGQSYFTNGCNEHTSQEVDPGVLPRLVQLIISSELNISILSL